MWVVYFILLMLSSQAFAIPAAVEQESLVVGTTRTELTKTVTLQVTIDQSINPDTSELIGRSYEISPTITTNGFFINNDGALLTGNSIMDDSKFREKAVDMLEPIILGEMATVEHVKKYGKGAEPGEIEAYKNYFKNRFGSLGQKFLSDPNLFKFSKLKEDIIVKKEEKKLPVSTINSSDGISVLDANGTNYPSVQLSPNQTIQQGDVVYVIVSDNQSGQNSQPGIKTIIVKEVGASGKATTDSKFGSEPEFVVDEDGEIVGFSVPDTNTFITSSKVASNIEDWGVENKESEITKSYRESLKSPFDKIYEQTSKILGDVLGITENSNDAETSQKPIGRLLTFINLVKNNLDKLILIAGFLAVFAAVVGLWYIRKRKRKFSQTN